MDDLTSLVIALGITSVVAVLTFSFFTLTLSIDGLAYAKS